MEQRAAEAGPVVRLLANGGNWSIREFVCTARPGERAFEERHEAVSIAMVAEGAFTYAADTGRALLHPGAFLLGNSGTRYCCGHDHSAGDRCIALRIAPDYFAEIAATAAGSSQFRFLVPMLPAKREMLPFAALLETVGRSKDALRAEEAVADFIAAVLRGLSGTVAAPSRVTASDERRVARALRHIEAHADADLDLDGLAAVAATSKFHFLRIFKRTTGTTPYQYVLGLRLRRAALRLLQSQEPVAAIAFGCGFDDLSTFNAAFRERFGMSPTAFGRHKAFGD